MIKVEIYHNDTKRKRICGFEIRGHAEFSEMGQDIVCSAVSVLVLNTINSIESFTETLFGVDVDDKDGGYLHFTVNDGGEKDPKTMLLLQSMVLGLSAVEDEYNENVKILYKEV